jgi:hypothetical protein
MCPEEGLEKKTCKGEFGSAGGKGPENGLAERMRTRRKRMGRERGK